MFMNDSGVVIVQELPELTARGCSCAASCNSRGNRLRTALAAVQVVIGQLVSCGSLFPHPPNAGGSIAPTSSCAVRASRCRCSPWT